MIQSQFAKGTRQINVDLIHSMSCMARITVALQMLLHLMMDITYFMAPHSYDHMIIPFSICLYRSIVHVLTLNYIIIYYLELNTKK